MPGWKFETYQLSGEGSTLFCPSLGQAAFVTVLDQNTVALAHDKIMAVLDGKDADEITEPQTQANDEAAVYPENQAGYDFYDNEELTAAVWILMMNLSGILRIRMIQKPILVLFRMNIRVTIPIRIQKAELCQ